MHDYKDMISRFRKSAEMGEQGFRIEVSPDLCADAADAIERLVKELAAQKDWIKLMEHMEQRVAYYQKQRDTLLKKMEEAVMGGGDE